MQTFTNNLYIVFYPVTSILAAAIASFFSCSHEISTPNSLEDIDSSQWVFVSTQNFKKLNLMIGKPKLYQSPNLIKVNGLLNIPPQNRASVTSPIGAIVKEILVVQTGEVKKGQALAILEHQDFIKLQEEYLSSLSMLAVQEKEYERQVQLGQIAAQRDVQTAYSQFSQLKAKVESLKIQLAMLNIDTERLSKDFEIERSFKLISPISGNVAIINSGIGAFVRPETELFQIIDNAHIHADMMVFERDIFKIKIGQKVKFVLTNLGDKTIEGVIFGIGKVFEPDTKTIAVHADIPHNEKYGLVPGMYLNAIIEIESKQTFGLPAEAFVLEADKKVCFKLADSSSLGYRFKAVEWENEIQNENFNYLLNKAFEVMALKNLGQASSDTH